VSKKAKKVAKAPTAESKWKTNIEALRRAVGFTGYYYATTQKPPLSSEDAKAWADDMAQRIVGFIQNERSIARECGVRTSASSSDANVAALFAQLATVAQEAAAGAGARQPPVPARSGIGVPVGVRRPSEPN